MCPSTKLLQDGPTRKTRVITQAIAQLLPHVSCDCLRRRNHLQASAIATISQIDPIPMTIHLFQGLPKFDAPPRQTTANMKDSRNGTPSRIPFPMPTLVIATARSTQSISGRICERRLTGPPDPEQLPCMAPHIADSNGLSARSASARSLPLLPAPTDGHCSAIVEPLAVMFASALAMGGVSVVYLARNARPKRSHAASRIRTPRSQGAKVRTIDAREDWAPSCDRSQSAVARKAALSRRFRAPDPPRKSSAGVLSIAITLTI